MSAKNYSRKKETSKKLTGNKKNLAKEDSKRWLGNDGTGCQKPPNEIYTGSKLQKLLLNMEHIPSQ